VSQSAQAVRAYDVKFFSGNDILFSGPDTSCAGGSSTTSGSDLPEDGTAKQNLESILKYFTEQRGLTLAAAAGITANIKTESASTYNPAIIQGGGLAPAAKTDSSGGVDLDTIFKPVDKQGFGLSQWTYGGTSPASRQGGLYTLAKSQKKDIIDLGLQLDYIWKELTTSYKTSTLDRIKDMTDPREATKIYMINYEGPLDKSEAAQNGRADDGEEIYNNYKGVISDGSGATINTTSSISSVTGGDCTSTSSGAGGIGVADGFTFPLKTTQAAIKKGTDGLVWCTTDQSSCHHDYNAADIFSETGTLIIAAKSGRVVSKTTDSCDYYGCNVTIMGDDNVLYYYTHMSKQAVVEVEAKVQAGQTIGSVGTNATAMNTARHLHFDMLPGKTYKFRPGCSSAECKVYPFINVQQYLVPAFQQLPKG